MNTNETTEIALSEDQENAQVLRIASASLTNIRENRKTLEEIAEKYKGLKIDGIDDKANYKTVSAGITATRGARTAVTKLTKAEKGYLKKAADMLEKEGELLIAIVSPIEQELKAEKERIDTLKDEAEQERLRLLEEQKQARIAQLFGLKMSFNGSYYHIGELTITPLQIVQSTEAQWEGFIAQATVEFEAVQLKEEEERKEQERIAEEQRKEQERLQKENEEQQKAKEAALAEKEQLRLERSEHRVDVLRAKGFEGGLKEGIMRRDSISVRAALICDSSRDEWNQLMANIEAEIEAANKPKPVIEVPLEPVIKPLNGSSKPHIEPVDDVSLDEVFSTQKKYDERTQSIMLTFSDNQPFIDTKVGKSTLRIYTEQFLEEASHGLTKEMVAATGEIGNELLFLVIKG